MGAWGIGNFENDDALDWTAELKVAVNPEVVAKPLRSLEGKIGGYLEAPECSVALAAAEVVAALFGRASASLPAGVIEWVATHRVTPERTLVDSARRAVEAILSNSELKELWTESDMLSAWRALQCELLSRLA